MITDNYTKTMLEVAIKNMDNIINSGWRFKLCKTGLHPDISFNKYIPEYNSFNILFSSHKSDEFKEVEDYLIDKYIKSYLCDNTKNSIEILEDGQSKNKIPYIFVVAKQNDVFSNKCHSI